MPKSVMMSGVDRWGDGLGEGRGGVESWGLRPEKPDCDCTRGKGLGCSFLMASGIKKDTRTLSDVNSPPCNRCLHALLTFYPHASSQLLCDVEDTSVHFKLAVIVKFSVVSPLSVI